MIHYILLYVGAIAISLWGLAHIVIPTRDIVQGFGPITKDNKRILMMEWIMEGLTLCFLGLLVGLVTFVSGLENVVAALVYQISALMLLVMTALSLLTGARTSILPMKFCPVIFATTAILFFLGSVL